MKNLSKLPSNSSRDALVKDCEPTLADLLNDPVLAALLAGDHIERADLEAVIRRAQRRLAPRGPATTPIAECCV